MKRKIVTGLIAAAILATGVHAKEFTKDRFDLLLKTSISKNIVSNKHGTDQIAMQKVFPEIVKRDCGVNSMSFNLKDSTGMSKSLDLYAYVRNLDQLYFKLLQAENYDMLAKIAYFVARPSTMFSEVPNADNAYVFYDSFTNLRNDNHDRISPFTVGVAYACRNNKSTEKISGMESLAYKDFVLALADNDFKKAKDIVNKVLKHKNVYKIYKDKLAEIASTNFGLEGGGYKLSAGKYKNEIVFTNYDTELKKAIKEAGITNKEAAAKIKTNIRTGNCTKSSGTYTGVDFVYRSILDKNNPKDYLEYELNFEDCLNK